MAEHAVLLVDDEVNVLRALQRVLRREPYRLLVAEGGAEALAILQSETIHLIITDQRMPGMSGTEFLQEAMALCPDTIRIILSGYAEMSVLVEAINQGQVYRLLGKPWDDEELKAVIRQALEHYDIVAENRSLVERVGQQNAELQRLNSQLEEMVTERTQSLRLSQQIVESLPLGVVGVSGEGEIMLCNAWAQETFTAFEHLIPGTAAEDVLPEALCNHIAAARATGKRRYDLCGQPVWVSTHRIASSAGGGMMLIVTQVGDTAASPAENAENPDAER